VLRQSSGSYIGNGWNVARVIRLVLGVVGGEGGFGRRWMVVLDGREEGVAREGERSCALAGDAS